MYGLNIKYSPTCANFFTSYKMIIFHTDNCIRQATFHKNDNQSS